MNPERGLWRRVSFPPGRTDNVCRHWWWGEVEEALLPGFQWVEASDAAE